MKRYLFIVVLIAGCNKPPENFEQVVSPGSSVKTVFATYCSEPNSLAGGGIVLSEDSSYVYSFSSCLESRFDSGRFKMKNDTIFFQSALEDKADTSNHAMNQVTPLTGRKYLLRNGHIYHYFENNKYDLKHFYLRDDQEVSPEEVLDANGNGFARLYNGRQQITRDGLFEKFKLMDGSIYYYKSDGSVAKIETYRDGSKVSDSIPLR